jgi:hypothetical protein
MIRMTLRYAIPLALALAGACVPCVAFAATTIKADDPKLQYTGRIDFSQPAAPVISWQQAGREARRPRWQELLQRLHRR